jgi:hypothetical protein
LVCLRTSEARKTAAFAMSCGLPKPLNGCRGSTIALPCSVRFDVKAVSQSGPYQQRRSTAHSASIQAQHIEEKRTTRTKRINMNPMRRAIPRRDLRQAHDSMFGRNIARYVARSSQAEYTRRVDNPAPIAARSGVLLYHLRGRILAA